MTTAHRATTPRPPRPTSPPRAVLVAVYAGCALTVLAALAPFLSPFSQALADHVQSGYPDYDEAKVDEVVVAYQMLLAMVGVLGIGCWLWTLWTVRSGKRWAPVSATVLFVGALCVALLGLTLKDENGEVGLAPLLGWLTTLPCVAGLAVVVLLWRRRS